MGSGLSKETHQCLGNDELMEILSRMPAKSVIKFSSVSKSLSNLVSDPFFIQKQIICSSRLDRGFFVEHKCILNRRSYDNDLEYFYDILPGPGDGGGISPDSLSFIHQIGIVLASSQGLLFMLNRTHNYDRETNPNAKEFVICNPATRRWASIPTPYWLQPHLIQDWCGVVFECHPNNIVGSCSDYTIVVPVSVEEDVFRLMLAVYCNGRWEKMCDLRFRENGLVFPILSAGLFKGHEGGLVVHYLCQRLPHKCGGSMEPFIITYDIKRRTQSRTLKLPKGSWKTTELSVHRWTWRMFKWRCSRFGDTIGLVKIHQVEGAMWTVTVWVLEDYEGGSWRRVLEKTTSEMGVDEEETRVVGCSVLNGTELVFSTRRKVYVYTMAGPDTGRLEVLGERAYRSHVALKFFSYANTLRPLSERYEKCMSYQQPCTSHHVETPSKLHTFVNALVRCFPFSYLFTSSNDTS